MTAERALAVLRSGATKLPAEVVAVAGRAVFGDYTVPGKAMDVCVVLGSFNCGYRVRAAVELGGTEGTRYVVTGGNAVSTGEREAVFMRELLVASGVRAEWILCDEAATRTEENLRHAVPLVAGLRRPDRVLRVAVVTGGFHLARTMGYARRAFAGTEGVVLYPAPAYGPNTGRESWHLSEAGRTVVVDELEKLLKFRSGA